MKRFHIMTQIYFILALCAECKWILLSITAIHLLRRLAIWFVYKLSQNAPRRLWKTLFVAVMFSSIPYIYIKCLFVPNTWKKTIYSKKRKIQIHVKLHIFIFVPETIYEHVKQAAMLSMRLLWSNVNAVEGNSVIYSFYYNRWLAFLKTHCSS
jgi:hypothetical protein